MGFGDRILCFHAAGWLIRKEKKEFSKLSELVWTEPQFFYDPFTFVNECNVGNGADSNELRLVSQGNVARKCRLHNARL